MLDLMITNARIIDGLGTPARDGSLGANLNGGFELAAARKTPYAGTGPFKLARVEDPTDRR